MSEPTSTEVPSVIEQYQQAHDRRDTAASLAAFHDDATVIDEDETYAGADRIRWWLDHGASEFTYTRTFVDATTDDGATWIVRNHIAGNFPGGTADLRYRFVVRDGLIEHLEIAP